MYFFSFVTSGYEMTDTDVKEPSDKRTPTRLIFLSKCDQIFGRRFNFQLKCQLEAKRPYDRTVKRYERAKRLANKYHGQGDL